MLIDTSGLFCCFDDSDTRHQQATTLFIEARQRIVPSYVLAEFIPLCQARNLNRRKALDFAADIALNAAVEVVWVDQRLHELALDLLQARLDKQYSLCDAVSFLLMRERQINDALTTDHHFEQEGFRRLL